MHPELFLSIIIPCYNVEQYAHKLVDSLQQLQDANDVEFLFVNDGSTDHTLSIIQAFAETDSRAVLLNQTNQGVSIARNNALAVAKGEFLLLLDGDDYLETNTINLIRSNIHDADILLSPVFFVHEKGQKKQQILNVPVGEHLVSDFLHSITMFPPAPQLIYRNAIVQQQHIAFNPQIKAGEVFDFTLSVLEHAHKIVAIQEPYYNYVLRSSSATHAPNSMADLSSLLLLKHLQNNISPSCKLTIYKLVTAFTFTKYIHLGKDASNYLPVVEQLYQSNDYRRLLMDMSNTCSIPVRTKIFIILQRILPHQFLYRALARMCPIMRIK